MKKFFFFCEGAKRLLPRRAVFVQIHSETADLMKKIFLRTACAVREGLAASEKKKIFSEFIDKGREREYNTVNENQRNGTYEKRF